jgi:hypothetical protein
LVTWDRVTRTEVFRALKEYDELGADRFLSKWGFGPTTTYDLIWETRRYPPKAILGAAFAMAVGRRIASKDFEGGKSGAVKVLVGLGFNVQPKK